MNWDALGALGELTGAIGVVISLLYLAKQIKLSSAQTERNSQIVRGTAYQQFRQQVNSVVALRAADPELADIWDRGLRDLDVLSPQEKSRLGAMFFMTVGNWESQYYLKEGGVIDERMGANRSVISGSPGFRKWWSERRDSYHAEFRDHIEQSMKQ